MATKQTKFISFSVKRLTISDYDTKKPIHAVSEFAGGNATLNAILNVVPLEGGVINANSRIEVAGGSQTIDATFKEAPPKLFSYGNQGTLTETASASASLGALDAGTGSTIATMVTLGISAASSIINDTIYIEALTSSTYKVINSSKNLDSGTKTSVPGSTVLVDNDVAPGVSLAFSAAVTFTVGDTATFDTVAQHTGLDKVGLGEERVCGAQKYVIIEGVACNPSDGWEWQFKLFKCLMTITGSPFAHGDYQTVTINAMAEADPNQTPERAGDWKVIRTIK